MRFGETWSAGVVPEWEAQYVNYNQGKRLIHRLEDEKIPLGSYRETIEPMQLPSPAIKPANERSPLLTFKKPRRANTIVGSLPSSAIPLSSYGKTKMDMFFKWLDKEIVKVAKFYDAQEDAAIRKFELLSNEMNHLSRHKTTLKPGATTVLTGAPVHFLGGIEMPSLPNAFKPKDKRSDKTSSHGSNSGDFRQSPLSYSHARHLLKTAMLDYYQSLQHLRGYRSLNATAMRKINKKFDKTFHCCTVDKHDEQVRQQRFIKSHVLDGLSKETEDLYAEYFEHGNHKFAVEKLQSNPEKYPHNGEVLATGLLLGLGAPLFVISVYKGVYDYVHGHRWETRALLNVWGCWLVLTLMCLLFSINILVWKRYRVNYVFVFEFNRYNYLDYREYPVMPSALFFLLSLFSWLTFHVDSSHFHGRYFPCIFIGIVGVLFLNPLKTHFSSARRWLQIAIMRLVFSGLFDVEFRDFFLGDLFCSLNYTLGNISFFFCLYGTSGWWLDKAKSAHCTSSQSHLVGFFNSLPGVWRLIQCIRRYLDTGSKFPHLYNGGKYSMYILSNMFLSLARIHQKEKWKICYIIFAALNAGISSFWDIVMDLSLGPHLRRERAFPKWSYYTVMVLDPILRFNWVLYLVFWNARQQSDIVSFVVAIIELVRRMIWVSFRVENEHSANVAKFRAFKDLHLPYQIEVPSGSDGQDVESNSHVEEPQTITAPPTPNDISQPSSSARRSHSHSIGSSILAQSPRLQSLLHTINFAHTEDFTRRKPTEDEMDEEE